ncbi:ComF family protein [Lacimicrobium sp. SS2-24]|uniref:ComF family protein n=1 Tax=Lacimicrobium sp. SS2-24 TaxID=2005569 RepID=UPI000B4AF4DC|nr:ComF family protein [Lacimicrobium sp. SS2-24]
MPFSLLKRLGAGLSRQSCLLCYQSSHDLLCPWCCQDLALFNLSACHYNLLQWPKIRQGLGEPVYHKLLACGEYQWPLDTLIKGLKFSRKTRNAKAVADLFYTHALRPQQPWPDVIIPVPLHRSRYQSRSYNQAMEIAKHLARRSGLPVIEACRRDKRTSAQTQLSGAQRRRNLKQAFTLVQPLRVARVAILDDILTTGSTVNSLSETLLQHYPDLYIEAWCIAVSPLHQ